MKPKPQSTYRAFLKIDGQREACVEGLNLDSVWGEINHYAAMYFKDGWRKSFVVEVREVGAK